MRFGSLFAGIGGLDLGLEHSGMNCAWQVEIDDHCTRVLEKHWPNVKRYRDVREVGAHNLEPVDLICGGFPCQDISGAGKREGIGGKRSGLWTEYYRIICELRPRYVLVENVSAILVRGMDVVLGDLAASGYDAEWQCLPASAFGARHRRDRAFLVAYTDKRANGHVELCLTKTEGEAETGLRCSHWDQFGLVTRLVAPSEWTATGRECDTRPLLLRNDDGVPHRVDRLRALGNAVVPQIAEWIGRCIMEFEAEHMQ